MAMEKTQSVESRLTETQQQLGESKRYAQELESKLAEAQRQLEETK